MKIRNPAKGHRQRLRQRFLTGGLSALHDYEILETLLNQSVLYMDTQPTAKALLTKFGSLRAVLSADVQSLMETEGVGESTATTLKLFSDIFSYLANNNDRYGNEGFLNRYKIALSLFDSLSNREYETVFFLCLDNDFRTVYSGEITQNKKDSVTLPSLLNIFSRAVSFGASYIYFAHNHPKGVAYPSKNDEAFTLDAIAAATSVDMIVLDHLIVTDIDTYSFFYAGKLGVLMRKVALRNNARISADDLDIYSYLYFPQSSVNLSNCDRNKVAYLAQKNDDIILTREEATKLAESHRPKAVVKKHTTV